MPHSDLRRPTSDGSGRSPTWVPCCSWPVPISCSPRDSTSTGSPSPCSARAASGGTCAANLDYLLDLLSVPLVPERTLQTQYRSAADELSEGSDTRMALRGGAVSGARWHRHLSPARAGLPRIARRVVGPGRCGPQRSESDGCGESPLHRRVPVPPGGPAAGESRAPVVPIRPGDGVDRGDRVDRCR